MDNLIVYMKYARHYADHVNTTITIEYTSEYETGSNQYYCIQLFWLKSDGLNS